MVTRSVSLSQIPYVTPWSQIYTLISWQVFLSVALILGDGLYTFIKIMSSTIINLHGRMKNKDRNLGNMNNSFGIFLVGCPHPMIPKGWIMPDTPPNRIGYGPCFGNFYLVIDLTFLPSPLQLWMDKRSPLRF